MEWELIILMFDMFFIGVFPRVQKDIIKKVVEYFYECSMTKTQAGRDGQPALCRLYYSSKDVGRVKSLLTMSKRQSRISNTVFEKQKEQLLQMQMYCENDVQGFMSILSSSAVVEDNSY